MAEDGMTLCRVNHDVQACARRGTRSAAPRLSHSPDRCELLFHTLLCAFTGVSQSFSVRWKTECQCWQCNLCSAEICQSCPLSSTSSDIPQRGSETEAVDLQNSSTIWMFPNAMLLSCAAKGIHQGMLIELWLSCAGARELTSYAPVPGPMHHKWHHHKKVYKACE